MLLNTILRTCWDIYVWDVIVNISAVKAEMRQILNNSKTGFTPHCFGETQKFEELDEFLPIDKSPIGIKVFSDTIVISECSFGINLIYMVL